MWAPAAALLAVSVAAGAAAPASAAGSSSATTGVTPTSITVGQVDTLSGPVPGLFLGAKDGTLAYLAYVNSHGGVYGRKIVLQADDDQFSSANYSTETQQLVNSTFALVGGFSLFDGSTGAIQAINAARIPDVTFSLSAPRASDPYNYSPAPLAAGGSRLGPIKYYKKAYPGACQHVATIYSNDAASAVVQSQAVISALQSQGCKIVFSEVVSAFQSDFTSEVVKMENDGVQMVYVVGMAVEQFADLASDIAQQDFHPKIVATNGVAYDSSYIPLAGSGANGTLTDQQSAMFLGQDAKAVPAVALFDKWMKKVAPSGHVDTYALFGWAAAQLFVQALRAAGPDPTRPGLLAALNKVTTFSAGGLLATVNPANKIPPQCWIVVKVVNGKWVRTSPDPKSGFVCNPRGYHYPPGWAPTVRAPGT